jgi:hypothetical protein
MERRIEFTIERRLCEAESIGRVFRWVHKNHIGHVICLGIIIVMGFGCQGHVTTEGMVEPVEEGVFFDSAVEGIEFSTETQSGITDKDGTFTYMEGEMITFAIGSVVLGHAPAGPMLSPVDLVRGATDETHPTVTNMARFLQTLDEDHNPENGITISHAIAEELHGRSIGFNMDEAEFEYDSDLEMFINVLNVTSPGRERMLVPVAQARAHLRNTLMQMRQMGPGAVSSHEPNGTSHSSVNRGMFLDGTVEGMEYETPTQWGMTDANGTFEYMEGETIMFSVGGVMLGEAMAQPMMHPIDLVPDANNETHPAVTNMITFLHSLDEDHNPLNGVTITHDTTEGFRGRTIDFDMHPDDFEYHADLDMIGPMYQTPAMADVTHGQSIASDMHSDDSEYHADLDMMGSIDQPQANVSETTVGMMPGGMM